MIRVARSKGQGASWKEQGGSWQSQGEPLVSQGKRLVPRGEKACVARGMASVARKTARAARGMASVARKTARATREKARAGVSTTEYHPQDTCRFSTYSQNQASYAFLLSTSNLRLITAVCRVRSDCQLEKFPCPRPQRMFCSFQIERSDTVE